jgi:hypothetical protein
LGFLIHPTFFVIPLANGIFAIFVVFNKNKYDKNTVQAAKLFLLIFGLIGLFISPLGIKIIRAWLSIPGIWGYKSFKLGMQIIKQFNIPIITSCIFGLIWLLKKDTAKGIYFLLTIFIPVTLIISASFFTNVRPAYIMSIYPLFFFLSGYFCAQLKNIHTNQNIICVGVVVLIIFCMIPEFVSHYSGMQSLDIRHTENFFKENYQKGDKIIPFPLGFKFYFENKYDLVPLPRNVDALDFMEKLDRIKNSQHRLWIVIYEPRTGIYPPLKKWILKNTKLVWEELEKRYDFSFKSLRIYLVE